MSTDYPHAVAEAQRRIGRNLLLYQATEQVLKGLLPLMRHEVAADCLAGFQARHAAYSKKTLGQFFESLRERVGTDQPVVFEKMLSDLLSQRNNLVHHAGLDLRTVESCRAAGAQLNQQHAEMLEVKNLLHDVLLEILRVLCDVTFLGTSEENAYRELYVQAKAARN